MKTCFERKTPALALLALLALLPTMAQANVPIFFVFAWVRVTLWWTVLLAIAIEAAALFAVFGLTVRRAVLAAVLINVGTAALGFVIYPFIGLISYPVLAPIVTETFGSGQIVEIAAYCIAAAVIDTPIELALLAALSASAGYGVKIGRKAAAVFFMANLISAAILFAAMQIGPRYTPVDRQTQDIIGMRFSDEVAFLHRMVEALPDHVDAQGEVEPQWRAGLEREAESLAFFRLEIETSWGIYPLVPMPLPDTGESFIYGYEDEQFDGTGWVTRGVIDTYGADEGGVRETRQVLHYRIHSDAGETSAVIRAMFLLSPDP